MLLYIIVFLLSLFGIIGFFNDIMILIYIGGIAVIIEYAIGLISGKLRTISFTTYLAIILSIIIINELSILEKIFVGLCFEGFIISLLGLIFIIYSMHYKQKY